MSDPTSVRPDRTSVHPGAARGWTRVAARVGSVAFLAGVSPLVLIGVTGAAGLLEVFPDPVRSVLRAAAPVFVLLFLAGAAMVYLPRPEITGARPIRSPVRGRWSALNGPATKVPSHGMHLCGQTYAIDLVHEPAPGARPTFGGRSAMRDPREYPAFGQPVHAPADGTVAAVHDGARDHRCRSNLLGYLYLLVEGAVRQLRGTTGLMGNHVVLSLDDGTHVAIAHLQRGSVRVAPGQPVRAGDVVASVGNSGNSSEPHVHLQLMDHRRPVLAAGLPFVFTDVVVDDAVEAPETASEPTVPEDGVVFHGGVSAGASGSAIGVEDGGTAR